MTNKEPSVGHAGHSGEGWDEEHNPLLDTSALEGTREPGPEKRRTEQRLGGSKQLTGTALQQTCIRLTGPALQKTRTRLVFVLCVLSVWSFTPLEFTNIT